jgi:hypothetical protein
VALLLESIHPSIQPGACAPAGEDGMMTELSPASQRITVGYDGGRPPTT